MMLEQVRQSLSMDGNESPWHIHGAHLLDAAEPVLYPVQAPGFRWGHSAPSARLWPTIGNMC